MIDTAISPLIITHATIGQLLMAGPQGPKECERFFQHSAQDSFAFGHDMDVFQLRDDVVHQYADYVRSFVRIREPLLKQFVDKSLTDEALWPPPLIQMNPSFAVGGWIDELVEQGDLHPECARIFRIKSEGSADSSPMRLHEHQVGAIRTAARNANYVLTTGTGSGKSLAYIIPIVNHILRAGRGRGIKAIVVYPMNALCNSQYGELEKFLRLGYGQGNEPVRFDRYTGQESQEQRDAIAANPPDILLTNYVMLELLLTRPFERRLVGAANGLRFLVLDELHTYRGRQGADVALLVRRVREACRATEMLCIGTSATMASTGTFAEQQHQIANVATRLFGVPVTSSDVIGETLTRSTSEVDLSEAEFIASLRSEITKDVLPPKTCADFVGTSMAKWLEGTFGLRSDAISRRLKRAVPSPIVGDRGAASRLSKLTGTSADQCELSIRRWLLAGNSCEPDPITKATPFAFRLHQFISRGDTVYASLEDAAVRHLSLSGQRFVPNHRDKVLFPLAFCRECGAEYFTVSKRTNGANVEFAPRDLSDRGQNADDDSECGFLYRDAENPWPTDLDEAIRRLPEDWLDESGDRVRIRTANRDDVPQIVRVAPSGDVSAEGEFFTYTAAPFRFCQCCGVSYRARRGESDFGRLATLASGGRSTATTILSLYAVRFLRNEQSLQESFRQQPRSPICRSVDRPGNGII